MQHKRVMAIVGGLAAISCVISCSATPNPRETVKHQPGVPAAFQVVNDAKGPAPEVPGARRGGIVTILGSNDFDRAAPWADYRGDGILVFSQLVTRTLTNYYEQVQPDGSVVTKIMGDLATDTGRTTDGCKTYTYTLRDGLTYSDGSPITSKDIHYGISLAFAAEMSDGPTYLQRWLAGTDDFASVYKGPYAEHGKLAPNVKTPDDKTIVFQFNAPHCDFPQAAALLTTVPMPQAKDPGVAKLETGFLASGPYKVQSWIQGSKMVLVRNDHWDASTDPLRHNYPDGYIFDWQSTDVDLTAKRLIANASNDQAAIGWNDIPSAEIEAASAVESGRQLDGDNTLVSYLYINTGRVTDPDVRRALLYSYNIDALRKIIGGSRAGTFPATTITSPLTPGYHKYNAYPDNTLTGNVDLAKQLLQGKTIPTLRYCYPPNTLRDRVAAAAKQNLERAGFHIVLSPLDPTNYFPAVGRKDTDCDLIIGSWGQDYPSSSTVLGVMMRGGSSLTATGNANLSYLDDPGVDAQLQALAAEPDPAKANQGYGALDEKIMKELCPVIPLYYGHSFSLVGSRIGGAYLSTLWSGPSLQNVYLKS